MIRWINHCKSRLLTLGLFLLVAAVTHAQEGDPVAGKKLFETNCAACHALDKQLIGPALGGVVERLKKDENIGLDWLYKWIKDNKSLRASGNKYANEVFAKFNKSEMQVFPNLTNQDISNILAYTSNPPKEEPKVEESTTGTVASGDGSDQASLNSKVMIGALFTVIGLLVWLLAKLRQLVKLQQSEELGSLNSTQVRSFGELYARYHYAGKALLGILVLFALYGVWNSLMWIGVYKGYKPEQPIYFSHKIHAGENKIDCQFCHSGAKYGKVSEIPSLNVCMNCHRNISEYKGKYIEPGKSKEFYDGEIKKIYEHAGWDSETQKYTGKTKPVEWVRIHNMQDFVYFNHSQHVIVGEQAIISSYNKKNPDAPVDVVCKACHGKVDTMNVVQMANDFTMGWCIECHRTTEVDMNNGYNKEYFQGLHEKLKKQYPLSEGKITVDAIGGMECGKCHY
ncbi:MAG: c-type cytochrome [Bergeyella sp.]|nr:c-type cytochrome [Bergeyella sp.]